MTTPDPYRGFRFPAEIPTEADPDRFNLAWSRPRSQDEDGF